MSESSRFEGGPVMLITGILGTEKQTFIGPFEDDGDAVDYAMMKYNGETAWFVVDFEYPEDYTEHSGERVMLASRDVSMNALNRLLEQCVESVMCALDTGKPEAVDAAKATAIAALETVMPMAGKPADEVLDEALRKHGTWATPKVSVIVTVHDPLTGEEGQREYSDLKPGFYINNTRSAFLVGPYPNEREVYLAWDATGKYPGERLERIWPKYTG